MWDEIYECRIRFDDFYMFSPQQMELDPLTLLGDGRARAFSLQITSQTYLWGLKNSSLVDSSSIFLDRSPLLSACVSAVFMW